ncbi:hypothetical protein M011DRAFT_469724 [Sporormia fimetaria CBS 119925]|uniref:Uncharacterized protein n=1 Tax=Sporormia fimetaria CBS 119925 TaxID=1340428 RepID=A0A6A6V405_9PLEO|nr:hypothetical protein M011DRAFT_469724 [Sporormia fimetaria CBS 119925]
MADVRALLRKERASRQPAARPQKTSPAPAEFPSSKKRKAQDDSVDDRKRTRTAAAPGVPTDFFDAGATPTEEDPHSTTEERQLAQDEQARSPPVEPSDPETKPPPAPQAADDADELDAFIQSVVEAPPPPTAQDRFAGAVIEAAPMTAAEVAAQEKAEKNAERARQEEELEAEKEDAERNLQDEFEEMEGLEERVRRLREKREALRKAHQEGKPTDVTFPEAASRPKDIEDDDSDFDEEDFDDWRFRMG